MVSNVQKWGNSLAVRIPRPFAAEIGIEEGSAVDVVVEDGGLVVRPRRAVKLRLEDLLEGVTRRNAHAESDTGPAVGREVW
jgi:antitoxin MazE